jgi:hypothetical protein
MSVTRSEIQLDLFEGMYRTPCGEVIRGEEQAHVHLKDCPNNECSKLAYLAKICRIGEHGFSYIPVLEKVNADTK